MRAMAEFPRGSNTQHEIFARAEMVYKREDYVREIEVGRSFAYERPYAVLSSTRQRRAGRGTARNEVLVRTYTFERAVQVARMHVERHIRAGWLPSKTSPLESLAAALLDTPAVMDLADPDSEIPSWVLDSHLSSPDN